MGWLTEEEKAEAEAYEMKGPLTKKQVKMVGGLMRKAGVAKKDHLKYLSDLKLSEKVGTGRVSTETYEELYAARKFDRYRRMVSTKLTKEEKLVNETTKRLKELTANASRPRLSTEPEKVGYKDATYGPPGLATPRRGVLNSESNECFYSYDGEWKDGAPSGIGLYLFADGGHYKGRFVQGKPHGEGEATYPNGTTYQGRWENGFPEGKGCATYASGSSYDGTWRSGVRHGHGTLTFPSGASYEGDFAHGKVHGRGHVKSATGFSVVGTFHRGFVNGPGALAYPDGKRDARTFSRYGGMTVKQLIDGVLNEKLEKAQDAIQTRDTLFGVRYALQLQDYVDTVRTEMNAVRAELKSEQEAVRRAKIRERKLKLKQSRERALDALIQASDDRQADVLNVTGRAANDALNQI